MATSDTLTRLQVERFRRRVGKARLAKVRRLIARERRAATKPKPVVVPEPPPTLYELCAAGVPWALKTWRDSHDGFDWQPAGTRREGV